MRGVNVRSHSAFVFGILLSLTLPGCNESPTDGGGGGGGEIDDTLLLQSAAFGNGRYVMVGQRTEEFFGFPTLFHSTDAAEWTEVRFDDRPSSFSAVAFGGGRFLAVGGNPTGILVGNETFAFTSTDGINWTEVTFDQNQVFLDALFANGEFFTLVLDERNVFLPTQVIATTDGLAWDTVTTVVPNGRSGLGFASGQFLLWDEAANLVFNSADGRNWEPNTIVGVNSVFFLGGDGTGFRGTGGTNCCPASEYLDLESVNGMAWSTTPNPSGPFFTDMAVGNGITVAVGTFSTNLFFDPGFILYSTDGQSWNQASAIVFPLLSEVKFLNGLFVVPSGDRVHTSSDGVNWSSRNLR